MKCNQPRPGFELVSPCPFPTTITITPRAPFHIYLSISVCSYLYIPLYHLLYLSKIFLFFYFSFYFRHIQWYVHVWIFQRYLHEICSIGQSFPPMLQIRWRSFHRWLFLLSTWCSEKQLASSTGLISGEHQPRIKCHRTNGIISELQLPTQSQDIYVKSWN